MSDEIRIYIGGVHASDRPMIIKTLLGSCIGVCLHDPVAGVGGMNHFMLPRGEAAGDDALRFGVHAMDCLIGSIMKIGGDRRRLVAKVFGGARVLALKGPLGDVPQRNIEFVSEFLETEGIPVLSADVGGSHARHVHFHTRTGRAFVKRVDGSRARAVVADETRAATPPAYGSVTLFP
jgi:chemotaxis receptor (MCP) glutamine deamidase CheD